MSELRQKTVLSIEDDPEFYKTLQKWLSAHGPQVFWADSLEAARTFLYDKLVPHLIILDLKLQDDSGITLLKEIKRHRGLSHIPLIVLTAYDDERLKKGVVSLGVSDYLVKPLHNATLLQAIRRALLDYPPLAYTFLPFQRPSLTIEVEGQIRKMNELSCIIRSPIKMEKKDRFSIKISGGLQEGMGVDEVVNIQGGHQVESGLYDGHLSFVSVSESEAQFIRRLMNEQQQVKE